MNERIKQLAKQTGYIWHASGDPQIYEFTPEKLEKFAELIIRECINEIAYIGKANEVFGDRTDRGGLNHILWTTETAIEKIKQHFGVEE
jgi:hypothetical protein